MQSAAAEQLILLDYAGEIEQLFFQRRLLSDEIIGLAGRPSSGSVVLVDTRLPGREWIDLTLYDAKTLAAPFRLRIVRERGDLYLLLGRLAIKASENSANAAERMAAVIQQATQMGIRKIIQDAL